MKLKITFSITAVVLFTAMTLYSQTLDSSAFLHMKFENNLTAASTESMVPVFTRADAGAGVYVTGNTGFGQAYDATDNASGTQITSDIDFYISGSNPRTLCAWIKGTEDSQKTIISMGPNTSTNRFTMKLLNGTLRAEINGGGTNSHTEDNNGTALALGDNNWHHLAIVYPGGNLTAVQFYVDGVAVANTNGSTATPNTIAATFQVGHRSGAEHYTGLLDDIRVYASALTSNEITSVMNGNTLGAKNVAFKANELKAYPTSVIDVLNLKTTVSEKLSVTVHNMLGKTVVRSYGNQVDMASLATGVYIVKVSGGNKVATLKVVKR